MIETMMGVITIGQSPRPDLVLPMSQIWGEGLTVRERGALDSLSRPEIAALEPSEGDEALVTRLLDGSEVIIGHREAEGLVAGAAWDLASQECDPILVLCTGFFAVEAPGARLIFPRQILNSLVRALPSRGALGVMVPHPSQEETIGGLWKEEGLEVITAAVSPYRYERDPESFLRAAEDLRISGVDMIVMDCMGYSLCMREAVRRAAGVPVLLASSAVAHVIASAFQ